MAIALPIDLGYTLDDARMAFNDAEEALDEHVRTMRHGGVPQMWLGPTNVGGRIYNADGGRCDNCIRLYAAVERADFMVSEATEMENRRRGAWTDRDGYTYYMSR